MRAEAALIGAGAMCEGIYLALTVRLPWMRFAGTLTSWRQIVGDGWGELGAGLGAVAVLFVAYLAGWWAIRGREGQAGVRRIVWLGAAVFAVTLVWLLPITSDLFTYLSQAHLVTDLKINPFLSDTLTPDPLLMAYPTRYSLQPSVYGPAWVLLSLPATVGPYDVAWGVFYLKAVAAIGYLACAWLAGRTATEGRARGLWPAGREALPALGAVYLFAWNPLVLLLGVGDGHNDLSMMAIVLLAIWWLVQERWLPAMAALILSAWVKYVSVILVPLALLYAWRRLQGRKGHPAWSLAGMTLAAAGAVSALAVLPFGSPGWLIDLVGRLLRPVNAYSAGPGLMARATAIGLGLFAGAYVVVLIKAARSTAGEDGKQDGRAFGVVMNAAFVAALMFFGLEAARAQPWHLIWVAPLAGLATLTVKVGGRAWLWAWPAVGALAAVLLAAQLWVEWGLPGI